MVSEKVIIVLIVVAILLSVVSIAVTMSASTQQLVPPKINIQQAKPAYPDADRANVGLIIAPPAP
jgi:hypothetical protein